MRSGTCLMGLVLFIGFAVNAEASQIYVVDGDTIKEDGQSMRLLDIDAPETYRPRCEAEKLKGKQATNALRRLVQDAKRIEVIKSGKSDKYKRQLVHLRLDGRDAGSLLVNAGLAVPWSPGKAAWLKRRAHWCGF